MNKIPVLVTGIGGGGVGEQILKCLRMSKMPYYIVGGDMNRNSKGFKLVDQAYILPPASDERYIETLIKICTKHSIKIAFYGSEPELKKMSDYRDLLKDNGIFVPLNPQEVIDTCMDKNKTMLWLKNNGFQYPQNCRVTCKEELMEIPFLPAVLKPSVGGGGSVNTFIARDERELRTFGMYLLELYQEFIAQEYVGSYDSEYTAGVINDMNGVYINSIAVKKNILSGLSSKIKVRNLNNDGHGDYLVVSSGISQGEIGRFPEVTEECVKIALKLGCTGPVNIQCRVQNGQVYVFEINPRISGTSSLRAMVGYNEPDILVRKYVIGEDIPQNFDYKSGYIVRGLDESFFSKQEMESIPQAIEYWENAVDGPDKCKNMAPGGGGVDPSHKILLDKKVYVIILCFSEIFSLRWKHE